MLLNQIKRQEVVFLSFSCFSNLRHRPFSSIDSRNFSKLLQNYFQLGRIEDAENLFVKMPQRDIVSCSIAIHGYATNGFHEKAFNLFSQMRQSGLVPNSFTVVGVLVSIAAMKNSMLAKSAHGLVVKSGLECNSIVATSMLDAYGKCGNPLDSYKIFKELKDPGVVTRNAIIAGLMNNGLCEEGVLLFQELRKCGFMPSVATILVLLNGCIALRTRLLCELVFCLTIQLGHSSNVSISNSVINMYSCLNDLNNACKVFAEMECRDVISWTTMMGTLVDHEYCSDVFVLFFKMKESGVDLDTLVLVNLVSACANLGDLNKGRQIHAQALIYGLGLELPLVNSLISMYSKCGDLDSSKIMFNQTPKRSLVSWAALASGLAQNNRPRDALDVVIKSRAEEGHSFDSIMLVSALTASAELVDFKFSQQLHCCIIASGFSKYRSVQNCLISAYSKCGNVDLSYIVFNEMGSIRDVVSWNAIIHGYGINGYGETALELYHEMTSGGQDPDGATYLSVLSACSHSGLVTEGLMVFEKLIEDNRIVPSKEHYGCVIDLLTRAGCFSEIGEFSGKYLEEMGLNAWKALLNGCEIYGNVELAEFAAKRISEMDPRELEQIVVLSRVYASVGRFREAESLRMWVENKGFVKSTGLSVLKEISRNCG